MLTPPVKFPKTTQKNEMIKNQKKLTLIQKNTYNSVTLLQQVKKLKEKNDLQLN